MSLKGIFSATFNYIESEFRPLVIISVYPAILLFMSIEISRVTYLVSLRVLLLGNQDAGWLKLVTQAQTTLQQLFVFYVLSLWLTVVAAHMSASAKARFTPSSPNFRNAIFVFLYSTLFFAMISALFFALTQLFFYLVGFPLGTFSKVVVPWPQAGLLIFLVPVTLGVIAWMYSVTHVNLPRIAIGYRPNLLKEVFQFSRGSQTALTLRFISLCVATSSLGGALTWLTIPIISAVIGVSGFPDKANLQSIVEFQTSVVLVSMLLDPLVMVFFTFIIWMFSIFLVQASWRIEGRRS